MTRRKIRVGSDGKNYTFEHCEQDGTKISDVSYSDIFTMIEDQLELMKKVSQAEDVKEFFDVHETLCNYVSVLRWRYKL